MPECRLTASPMGQQGQGVSRFILFRGVSTTDTIAGAQLAHEETRPEPVGSLSFCHIALPPDGLAQDLAGILLAQETQLLSAQLSLHGEYGSAFRLTSPESCRDMLGSWSSVTESHTPCYRTRHSFVVPLLQAFVVGTQGLPLLTLVLHV